MAVSAAAYTDWDVAQVVPQISSVALGNIHWVLGRRLVALSVLPVRGHRSSREAGEGAAAACRTMSYVAAYWHCLPLRAGRKKMSSSAIYLGEELHQKYWRKPHRVGSAHDQGKPVAAAASLEGRTGSLTWLQDSLSWLTVPSARDVCLLN